MAPVPTQLPDGPIAEDPYPDPIFKQVSHQGLHWFIQVMASRSQANVFIVIHANRTILDC